MNPSPNNFISNPLRREADGAGEATLRLIASLPAPAGLSDRVRAGLRGAPQAGPILLGRGPLRPPFGWMHSTLIRGAAAAAIVCVVAGGGRRIYSHVHPAGSAKVADKPAPVSASGNGFSSAGAKRVPETLEGPVLTYPVAAPPVVNVVEKAPAQPKPGTTKKKRVTNKAAVPVQ